MSTTIEKALSPVESAYKRALMLREAIRFADELYVELGRAYGHTEDELKASLNRIPSRKRAVELLAQLEAQSASAMN